MIYGSVWLDHSVLAAVSSGHGRVVSVTWLDVFIQAPELHSGTRFSWQTSFPETNRLRGTKVPYNYE